MRAMPSTSPFLVLPFLMSCKVVACMLIRPLATAVRLVCALSPTSTMCAWPLLSKWVSVCSGAMKWDVLIFTFQDLFFMRVAELAS